MQERIKVLLGSLCLKRTQWHTLSIQKRIGIIFGLPFLTCVVTYLVLLLTINWQERLCEAAREGDINKAKTALFFNASPVAVYSLDGNHLSAVTYAIRNKHPKVFTLLISRGGKIDYKLYDEQKNWYHISSEVVKADDPPTIEAFIAAGGALNNCTYMRHNALTYAVELQKAAAVKTLSKYIGINTYDDMGLLPLTHAYKISDNTERKTILDILISLGADIDHRVEGNNTALHQYLSLGDVIDSYEKIVEICDFIKEYSKNGLDRPNRFGKTPLMLAAQKGNKHAMDGLIHRGSKLSFTNKYGEGVFDVLSKYDHDELFNRYAKQLKKSNPKEFAKLKKKFPNRISKKGIIIKRQKRIARSRQKIRGTKGRGNIGKKFLRRLGLAGFLLSFF